MYALLSRVWVHSFISCSGITEDLFWGPPFPPMCNVCNSKCLLVLPRFSVRARECTLCLHAGELGSLLSLFSHFLESTGVSSCLNSRWGCLWTELASIGFHWALPPCLLSLRYHMVLSVVVAPLIVVNKGLRADPLACYIRFLMWKIIHLELVLTAAP